MQEYVSYLLKIAGFGCLGMLLTIVLRGDANGFCSTLRRRCNLRRTGFWIVWNVLDYCFARRRKRILLNAATKVQPSPNGSWMLGNVLDYCFARRRKRILLNAATKVQPSPNGSWMLWNVLDYCFAWRRKRILLNAATKVQPSPNGSWMLWNILDYCFAWRRKRILLNTATKVQPSPNGVLDSLKCSWLLFCAETQTDFAERCDEGATFAERELDAWEYS